MTPERLAEIQAADDESGPNPGCPGARHRRELLAEVQRLRAQNAEKDQTNSDLYAANLELRAEVQRLRDENDALNAHADRAATAWHDLAADCTRFAEERDQARRIAHMLALHTGHHATAALCHHKLGLDALPGWLTDNTKDTT